MSVPKYKRKESKLQVFVNATRLRRAITQWCLRDFGIKSRVRKISNLFSAVKFLSEDAALVEELFNKYPEMNDGRVLEDFPAWIVQKCKFSLIDEVNSYYSWRQAKLKECNCYKTIKSMDDYYRSMYERYRRTTVENQC